MGGPLGLALPRRFSGAWEPDELELAAALMPGACVVAAYEGQTEEVRAAQVASARALVARTGARLLLQARESGASAWAPNDWAGECARRAGFFGIPLEMIPGEQLDLAEGPGWLLRFAQRYRRLRRGERLHLPAPAWWVDEDEAAAAWRVCARADVGKRFDVVDVLADSEEQMRTLPRLAHEALGLPVDLTECGHGVDPALVAAEVRAYPWLDSACYAMPADAFGDVPAVLARVLAAQHEPAGRR